MPPPSLLTFTSMQIPRTSRLVAVGLTCAVGLTACGGSGGSSTTGTTDKSTGPALSGALKGAGSTFQKTFNDEAIIGYKSIQSGVTVTYGEPKGSGAGRTALADQQVDLAGTDGLVKDADKASFKGGDLLYVPTVAAPITVSFNLSGVKDLVLDADSLGRIFTGTVTSWDDAGIKALNPGATLPSTKIVPIVRQDSSGTTENFTKYLAAASPSIFTVTPGGQPAWPAAITTRSPGNSGVAGSVKSTPGGIGYVDLADAKSAGLRFAAMKNKSGKAVKPTVEAAAAALAGTTIKDDLTYDPLDAAGAEAYPITAPTWVLVYARQADPAKAALLKSFLGYLVGDGQKLAAANDYAALPPDLAAKAKAQVDKIT
jgi:phosphate transport system substrate-binding protein